MNKAGKKGIDVARAITQRAAMLAAALIVLSEAASVHAAALPARPTKIVVFGDSLSDTGNAFVGSLHTRAPSPPYFAGRFSNGPVWVEIFARAFGLEVAPALKLGTNFAIGGAKAGSGADSLRHQVDVYLALSLFRRLDPDTLYIVFGGGNDVRSALKRSDPATVLAAAALAIRSMIQDLAAHGAVNFLVPNLPNRGHTPAARKRGTAATEEAFSRAFDTALDAALSDVGTNLHINLIRVDLWSAAEQFFATPKNWGFANLTDPCLVTDETRSTKCAEPDSYVFWDDIHPTTRAHALIAGAALDAYDQAIRSQSPGRGEPPVASVRSIGAGTAALDKLQREVLRLVQEGVQ